MRTLHRSMAVCGVLAFSTWLFSVLYGFAILDPHRMDWLLQEDPAQAFFGLNYFLLEPLHWPWGSISTFNIPTGTSLVFTDAIPWLSLLVKCGKTLIPFDSPIQISGWWILVCLLLQGLFGLRLFLREGLAPLPSFLASLILVAWPALHFRSIEETPHYTLMGHFLILAALSCVLDWVFRHRFNRIEWAILLTLSIGIHFYLFVMTFLLYTIPILEASWERESSLSHRFFQLLRSETPLLAILGGLAYCLGYFEVPAGDSSSAGFGLFSMDLISFLNSEGFSGTGAFEFMRGLKSREGFQYLGLGAILSIGIGLSSGPIRNLRPTIMAIRIPVIAFIAIFALSSRIGIFGHTLPVFLSGVLEFVLFCMALRRMNPSLSLLPVMFLAGALTGLVHLAGPTLRSSGRFGWILGYAGFIFAVLQLRHRLQRALSPVLLGLVLIQAWDLAPLLDHVKRAFPKSDMSHSGLPSNPQLDSSMHPKPLRILIYGSEYFTPPELVVWALQHHLPVGPIYLPRFDRNRRQAFMEALWQRILKGRLMAGEVIAAEKTEELREHLEEVRKNPGVRIKDMGHYYLILTR